MQFFVFSVAFMAIGRCVQQTDVLCAKEEEEEEEERKGMTDKTVTNSLTLEEKEKVKKRER